MHDAEIARVPEEAEEVAERAAQAVAEFERESTLTRERLEAGLRAVADRPRVALDALIGELQPKLSIGELSVPERDRLVELAAEARRMEELDVSGLLVERAEAIAGELEFADRTEQESAERVERAAALVARAEEAARQAERHGDACHEAGLRARGRLLRYRGAATGLTDAELEDLRSLLAGDLEAAEAGARACRAAGEEAARAMVDALGALDGKSTGSETRR